MNTGTTISELCDMVEKRMCSEPECGHVAHQECVECKTRLCINCGEQCEYCGDVRCLDCGAFHGMSCEKAPKGEYAGGPGTPELERL